MELGLLWQQRRWCLLESMFGPLCMGRAFLVPCGQVTSRVLVAKIILPNRGLWVPLPPTPSA